MFLVTKMTNNLNKIILPIILLYCRYLHVETAVERHPCAAITPTNYYNNSSKCHLTNNNRHLRCFMDHYNDYYHENLNKWRLRWDFIWILTMCDGLQSILDPEDVLLKFPYLKKLIIVNGNLTKITTSFPKTKYLQKIHIIGTRLNYLSSDVFANLPSLRTVDLRNNALAKIDSRAINVNVDRIYLAGNPWKCDDDIAWILNTNDSALADKIEDREKLLCSNPYEGRPLITVMEIIMTLKEECKQTVCDCELSYVIARRNNRQIDQRSLMAFVTLNCSQRELKELPKFLPANTSTLHLVGNKISDLTPLISNPTYKNVIDLYLDDNSIETISALEGSYWLEHFRVFSLRRNELSDLPTYALENVLLHSSTAVSIFLSDNPWTCDCHFTPGFQDLLIRYTSIVKDVNNIKCRSPHDNPENFDKLIRDLTRTEICIIPNNNEFPIRPLDVLNIILALMILFIIGKLLYDYWLFKKTGELPWIVTKIP